MSKSLEKPKSPYPLRMTEDVKAWVKERAKSNDRTLHAELNRILREAKEADKQEAQPA